MRVERRDDPRTDRQPARYTVAELIEIARAHVDGTPLPSGARSQMEEHMASTFGESEAEALRRRNSYWVAGYFERRMRCAQ